MPFDKAKFIGLFKTKTRERLQNLNKGILKLEKNLGDKELLDKLRREAHTIRGSATLMGFKRIAHIAHKMEDGLEKVLKGEIKVGKVHVDQLFKCLDSVDPLLEDKIMWDEKGVVYPHVEELCRETEAVFSKSCESEPKKKTKMPKVKERKAKKKRKTILLVEDAISTATLEKNILESVGYSVVVAHDGRDALERAGQGRFDLVITDILMPRMDGFELTQTLKNDKIYKDIPIIIVTTREADADKRLGLEAGAEAYILKSEFTSERLLETVERLIG